MIHRRLLVDDGRGSSFIYIPIYSQVLVSLSMKPNPFVQEKLLSSIPFKIHQGILGYFVSDLCSSIRPKMLLHNNPPLLAFSTASTSQKWLQTYTVGL